MFSAAFFSALALGLTLSDGPILVIPGGHGEPGIYGCPDPATLCYTPTGTEIAWGSIHHPCVVEYSNGKGYCFVKLSDGCWAFESEREYYHQCYEF